MVLCQRSVGLCAVLFVAGQILINQASAADAVLLDFRADWCAPCRAMDPVVKQLAAEGYQVRVVNIDQDQATAQKFKVDSIPTFVMTVDGREVARASGMLPKSQLIAMCKKADPVSTLGEPRGVAIANVSAEKKPRLFGKLFSSETGSAAAKVGAPEVEAWEAAEATRRVPARPVSDNGQATRFVGNASNMQHFANSDRLIQATVRLRIEDANGVSKGSGTIVDAREGEALILTCGHVFREFKKDGQIWVDLFGPNAPQKLPAKLVSYDLTSDVGLVRVSTNHRLVVAPVAPTGYSYRTGDQVTTVGCDGGADATAHGSQIISINRFRGPANVQVAGLPVQGRSGGGLFNAHGQVIGVCNAADKEDNQGLFAAIGAIHSELDRAKLSFIYTRGQADGVALRSAATAAKSMPRIMPRSNLDAETAVARADGNVGNSNANNSNVAMASVRAVNGQTLTADEERLLSELRSMPPKSEVICLIRPLDDPTAKSRVLQVNNVSQAVWQGLAEDRAANSRGNLTSLETAKPMANEVVGVSGNSVEAARPNGAHPNEARPNDAVRRMVSLDDADRVWPPRR